MSTTTEIVKLSQLQTSLEATKTYIDKQDAALGLRIDGVVEDIEGLVTAGGEPNVIETVKVNGVALTPDASKAVDVVVPACPEYTIVKAAESGEYAAIYNLTKDGVAVGAAINIPKDLVVKSGSVVGDKIVLVLNDEAGTQIEIAVGSLIEYVTSGSAAGDMIVVAVDETTHKVTATITDGTITLAKLATEVKDAIAAAESNAKAYADGLAGNYDAKGSAAQALTDAKAYADGLAGNYDAKGAAATALSDAKAYADGLAKNYDAAGAAATAETNAKAYADGLAANYDAAGSAASALSEAKTYADGLNTSMDTRVKAVEAKAHEHSNKTVLDGITAEKVAAWDAAEANAKAYVDGMIASDTDVSTMLTNVFGA